MPRRILVVDDDPMVATTIQRVLRPEGYEVEVALGGQAALDLVVRARQLGGVTAWRSSANQSEDRWLWVQATPLVSREDAEIALAAAWDRALKNLGAQVRLTGSAEGPALTIPADRMTSLEQHTQGPSGAGVARYVAWSYRNVVSVLAGSAKGEPWGWQELAALASRQSSLIDAAIDTLSMTPLDRLSLSRGTLWPLPRISNRDA